MLIRLILFTLFFLWVIRAPLDYRAHIKEAMAKDNTELRLKKRQSKCEQAFLQDLKLPIGDKNRLKAICDLAQVRWQQMAFESAESLYKLAIIETKPSIQYNEALINTKLCLAAVLGYESKFTEQHSCYLWLLDYDKKFLSSTDRRLGRDLNNLGLNYYLEASRKDRGNERTALMKSANDYLTQSIEFYRQQPEDKQRLSIALFNQYLVLRDLGLLKESKTAKEKAESLDLAFNRPCHSP